MAEYTTPLGSVNWLGRLLALFPAILTTQRAINLFIITANAIVYPQLFIIKFIFMNNINHLLHTVSATCIYVFLFVIYAAYTYI